MIISCPECGARYRLPATTNAENARMRCAACNHRWIVAATVSETMPAPALGMPEPIAAEPSTFVAPADSPAPQSSLVRNVMAVAIGSALALVAAAVWLKRIDPAQLPLIGPQVAQLLPPAAPLAVAFTAQTTVLASGDRLLEINGRVTNTGTMPLEVPTLEARLAGPGGTVRRWRITVPTGSLAPGTSAAFASTATDFTADATIVGIRPGR